VTVSADAISLDRNIAWRTAFIGALLLWPLILFGRPAYFADSTSYYKGGRAAVAFVESKLRRPNVEGQAAVSLPATAPSAGASEAAEAKGARSIPYSVAAYVLGGPKGSLLLLALAQAFATAFVIAVTMGVARVRRARHVAAVGIVVAGATPAACFASLTVPDIWAGLLIAALVCIATAGERLSTGLKLTLVLLAGFAVASHASHPPLAAGLCALGAIWLWCGPERKPRQISWLVAPLLLGVAATVVSGFIGFGTVSLAAKRFPLALARSIEDGPARWYLERHCMTKHYAVCEVFGSNIPRTVPEFLWKPNGLDVRATPAQMDRIRDEEQEILVAAAQAYPKDQAGAVVKNIALQIVTFGLTTTQFEYRIALDAAGSPHMVNGDRPHPYLIGALEWLSIVTALAGITWLAWRFRRLMSDQRAMAMLMVAGLLGNAVICAVFSGVADRYQARVIWLVPLFALLFLFSDRHRLRQSTQDDGQDPAAFPTAQPRT
jgi:hypothetical protein